MSQALPPPPYTVPMLNPAGLISTAWAKWFQTAYLRMGAASALSNVELASTQNNTSAGVTQAITYLEGLINQTGSTVISSTSGVYSAVASGQWQGLTGNSITLTQGRWLLSGLVAFSQSSGVAWVRLGTAWSSTNGGDSSAYPGLLSATTNLTVLNAFPALGAMSIVEPGSSGNGTENLAALTLTVSVQANTTATIYLNSYANFTGTAANTSITAYASATLLRMLP